MSRTQSMVLFLGALMIGGMMAKGNDASAGTSELQDFDARWDYAHPDSTEAVFRSLLPAARSAGDADYLVQLLTQIARTQGLQRKFTDAHATLDEAAGMLTDSLAVARVRYLLERGRVFNSAQEPERARPLFLSAWEEAQAAGAEYHAIDAAHMMGIIEPPAEALVWNRKAIAAAEAAGSERARGWLGSLYNNVGWTYHDLGDYDQALDMFEKGLAFREEKKQPRETRIAKWCVARTYRSLGRTEEALAMQRTLEQELTASGETDGFVDEEIGECLLALGRPDEAAPSFARAHELLSKDPWFVEKEGARLARLAELGGVSLPAEGARPPAGDR